MILKEEIAGHCHAASVIMNIALIGLIVIYFFSRPGRQLVQCRVCRL